jgi:chromosomal replication initiator protein
VENLKGRLGEEVVGRWIAPLKLTEASELAVTLEAPNEFFRDWIVSHYQPALRELLGGRLLTMTIAAAGVAEAPPLLPVEREEPPSPPSTSEQLTPRFTFERFVVGPSNRFAHAASLAVAESPAKAYNPLFIYGGVGLGKTHLMQAIGHAIAMRLRAPKIAYVSSEQFTNELIEAIQTKTTVKFRERYRTVDALLIDDIQFIAGKESTQEEFFHTFNTLYDAHKQIVLSSDRPPKDIDGIEERLVSRFGWGLVTDIQPPDLETRIAILRKKAVESGVDVPAAVTNFIAAQITSNIRELEGALIRVVAYCRFFSKSLSVDVAQDVLKEMVREVGSRVTLPFIQQRVSDYFKLSLEELKSVRRQRSVLYPRQVAMYLCRTLTDSSLPEIGRAFGGKDHSTVLHAVEKISKEMAQDGHKKHLLAHLTELITTHAARESSGGGK